MCDMARDRLLTRAANLRGENAPQCIKLPYKNAISSCV